MIDSPFANNLLTVSNVPAAPLLEFGGSLVPPNDL